MVENRTTTAEHVVSSFAKQQCWCPVYGGQSKNTMCSI